MKLKNVILVMLVLYLIGIVYCSDGTTDCGIFDDNCPPDNNDDDDPTTTTTGSITPPPPTQKPTESPTTQPAQPTPSPSESTTPSTEPTTPPPEPTTPPPSNGGNGESVNDPDNSDENTTDSPSGTAQPIIKQREKDPYFSKSISGSYIAYAIGIVCIVFIMVILYKKFRARQVAPIDIDTANYSVLEMRD